MKPTGDFNRSSGIGASSCAAGLDLSPYDNSFDVYQEIIGEADPKTESEAMYLGTALEDGLLGEYIHLTGVQAVKPKDPIRSPEFPYLYCSPDGLADDRGVEIKLVNSWESAKRWGDNEVPIEYLLQCHHSMLVTGKPQWDLFALVAGKGRLLYTFTPDPALNREIVAGLGDLWQRAQERRPPVTALLAPPSVRWRRSNGTAVVIPPGLRPAIRRLREVKADLSRLSGEEKALKTQLQEAMGEAAELRDGDDLIATWKSSEVERLDTKGLKLHHPVLAKEFTITKPERRFLLKGE